MTLDEIKTKVDPVCRRYRVQRLDLFGSYARNEAGTDSDIDFCVSFDALQPAEYARQFFGLLHDLEDAFHITVDLLTEASIRKVSLKKKPPNGWSSHLWMIGS